MLLRLLLLMSLCLIPVTLITTPLPAYAAVEVDEDDEDDEDDDDSPAIRRPVAQPQVDDWVQKDSERIAVDQNVINRPWRKVPFDPRHFDIPEEQLQARWPQLMRGLLLPYPSPEYLEKRLNAYPELMEELGPEFAANPDYQALSKNILTAWRYFFRGDFRAAKDHGMKYGAFGKVPAYFSQIIYAVYLSDKVSEKHQLLQDVADQVGSYVRILRDLKDNPEFHEDYMMMRLGYAYAIARIAEEVSPAVAIGRNYLFKISGAANDVLDVHEDHPIGLAFRAGIDANLIRVVGKAVGRITFGARQSRARDYFERSFEKVDDMAIVYYEFGNALLYINKARDEAEIIAAMEQAMNTPPTFAMEALDSIYAAKRLKEVQDFLRYGRSFRSYERQRRNYIRRTDANPYNVLTDPILLSR